MAQSKVQVCNYSLSLIGCNNINDLDEQSEEARKCNAFFDITVEACLNQHDWNFATKRETLALLDGEPAFDFTQRFQLPNDCLRVIKTNLTGSSSWKVEGRELLCNSTSVKIKYISLVTDYSKWSPQFTTYFCAMFAAALAYPLTTKTSLQDSMEKLAEKELDKARGLDSTEGTATEPEQDDWYLERIV